MLKFGYKKQILLLGIIPLVITIIEFYVGYISKVRVFEETVETFLELYSIVILISLFLLFLLRIEVYKSWRKFALIYLPLAVLAIHAAPESGDMLFDISKETVTIFFAGLFLLISLILIIVKSLTLRGK